MKSGSTLRSPSSVGPPDRAAAVQRFAILGSPPGVGPVDVFGVDGDVAGRAGHRDLFEDAGVFSMLRLRLRIRPFRESMNSGSGSVVPRSVELGAADRAVGGVGPVDVFAVKSAMPTAWAAMKPGWGSFAFGRADRARPICAGGCSGPVLASSVSFSEEVKKAVEPSALAAWKAAGGRRRGPASVRWEAETWIVQASSALRCILRRSWRSGARSG